MNQIHQARVNEAAATRWKRDTGGTDSKSGGCLYVTTSFNTVLDVDALFELAGPMTDIIERAVRNAPWEESLPRWSAIERAFGYGSTISIEICRIFGLDPHETKTPWSKEES